MAAPEAPAARPANDANPAAAERYGRWLVVALWFAITLAACLSYSQSTDADGMILDGAPDNVVFGAVWIGFPVTFGVSVAIGWLTCRRQGWARLGRPVAASLGQVTVLAAAVFAAAPPSDRFAQQPAWAIACAIIGTVLAGLAGRAISRARTVGAAAVLVLAGCAAGTTVYGLHLWEDVRTQGEYRDEVAAVFDRLSDSKMTIYTLGPVTNGRDLARLAPANVEGVDTMAFDTPDWELAWWVMPEGTHRDGCVEEPLRDADPNVKMTCHPVGRGVTVQLETWLDVQGGVESLSASVWAKKPGADVRIYGATASAGEEPEQFLQRAAALADDLVELDTDGMRAEFVDQYARQF